MVSAKKIPQHWDVEGYTELRKEWLGFFCVALVELVDAASGIHTNVFTGVKRVAGVRNLQFDQRIFVAIFEFNGFAAAGGAAAQKRIAITHVLKYHKTVLLRMDIFFHVLSVLRPDCNRALFLWAANVCQQPLRSKFFVFPLHLRARPRALR